MYRIKTEHYFACILTELVIMVVRPIRMKMTMTNLTMTTDRIHHEQNQNQAHRPAHRTIPTAVVRPENRRQHVENAHKRNTPFLMMTTMI